MNKNIVTISRYWDKPEIITTISNESISLNANLSDFMAGLVEELWPLGIVFTKRQLAARLEKAAEIVIKKIKEESAKAI
jgi:hypothetical protein